MLEKNSRHLPSMDERVSRSTDRSEIAKEENVVERLQRYIAECKKLGFDVRSECLDGGQPSWCVIGGRKTIFIDLSQTAAEQLRGLDEILWEYHQSTLTAQRLRSQAA